MKLIWTLGLALGAILLGSTSAQAFDKKTQGQCIADARAEAKTCVALCKDDFRADKDSCRNIDHTCGDAAREAREGCVDGVLRAQAQCVESACAPYLADIVACREQYPVGDPDRDRCVDNAQLLNFQCRDRCRESVQLARSLKACAADFRADIKACPPPAPAE